MFSQLLAQVLAALVGVSLGVLGSGGSIITTPLLVYVAHVPPQNAIGMSLVIVGITSAIGAFLQFRRGNLAFKPIAFFASTGMVGSLIGSMGTSLFQTRTLLLLFAGIMVIVAIRMWQPPARLRRSESYSSYPCLLAGFVVGLLTGFLGIGGGFLIVPALVLFAGLETHKAAGTSLAIITFNCATGLVGQLQFIQIDWKLLAGFLIFTVSGMIAGNIASTRLSDYHLRKIFSVAVLVIAVAIGWQNLRPQ